MTFAQGTKTVVFGIRIEISKDNNIVKRSKTQLKCMVNECVIEIKTIIKF